MKEGDVIILPMAQADARTKNRPAIVLREMPPFRDMLVCGVSTQLHQAVPDFDETITPNDGDFKSSGLVSGSLIRLAFLLLVPRRKITGSVGSISSERHARLLQKLADYLRAK